MMSASGLQHGLAAPRAQKPADIAMRSARAALQAFPEIGRWDGVP